MSFNTYARKVYNMNLSFKARRSDFRSCIVRYARPKETFQNAYSRYSTHFGFDEEVPDAGVRLSQAMNAMYKERNVFLEKLRLFDKKRIKEKMRGHRSPSKSSSEDFVNATGLPFTMLDSEPVSE